MSPRLLPAPQTHRGGGLGLTKVFGCYGCLGHHFVVVMISNLIASCFRLRFVGHAICLLGSIMQPSELIVCFVALFGNFMPRLMVIVRNQNYHNKVIITKTTWVKGKYYKKHLKLLG